MFFPYSCNFPIYSQLYFYTWAGRRCQIILNSFLSYSHGGPAGEERCRIRSTSEMGTGFSGRGVLPIVEYHSDDGNTLPSSGMQVRSAVGARRTGAVRAAFYAVAGGKLRGDAERDGAGQCAARPAEGNHAFHNGKRRAAGAGGHQRAAPYG